MKQRGELFRKKVFIGGKIVDEAADDLKFIRKIEKVCLILKKRTYYSSS